MKKNAPQIDEIKKLVQSARVESAIERMYQLFSTNSWGRKRLEHIRRIEAQYSFSRRENLMGTINSEVYNERISKIVDLLLLELKNFQDRQKIFMRILISIRNALNDKLILALIGLSIFIFIMYFLFNENFLPYSKSIDSRTANSFLVSTLSVISLIIFYKISFNYLNQYNATADNIATGRDQRREFGDYSIIDTVFSSFGVEEMSILRNRIIQEIADFYPIENDGEKYSIKSFEEKILKDHIYREISSHISLTEKRIKSEILLLQKRANSNLLIGTSTAIAALTFMIYSIIGMNYESNTYLKFIIYFLPRFTLIIFIQIFSFYFLKLYRTSLNEVKYYQNELTNLELKFISLRSLLLGKNSEKIEQALFEFIKIDRNPVLKDSEKTIGIELLKSENEFHKNIIDKYLSIDLFKNRIET